MRLSAGDRNFAVFDVPEGKDAITLLPDNDDEGSAQGQRVVAVRQSQGIDTSIEPCPVTAGDWADLLRPLASAALDALP